MLFYGGAWGDISRKLAADILRQMRRDANRMLIAPNPEPHDCSSDDGVSVSYWANLSGAAW
jgi:hypothetical protein